MKKEPYSIKHKEEGGEFNMNSSNSSISSRVEIVQRELNRILQRRISSSETMSLYPDLSVEDSYLIGGLKKLDATEALGLLLIFPRDSILYCEIRLEIAEVARTFQYQGLWNKVQKVSELGCRELQLYFLLESGISEYEIFGNLIDNGLRRLQRVRIFRPKYQVKYPQRKRGYNDHGSRKDDSRWLPDRVHLGPNPPKRDRSNFFGNMKKTLTNFLYG